MSDPLATVTVGGTVMQKLLLIILAGMLYSNVTFGSLVPPELELKAPGFDLFKEVSHARKPGLLTRPAHLHPAWMESSRTHLEPEWLLHPRHSHPVWMRPHS
jgi:hypothetical protein